MFKGLVAVDILGETSKIAVVLEWMLVGTLRFTHILRNQLRTYTLFTAQLNQKVIPLLYSKINTLNLWLYPLSTGPIITTTYINTNEMNKRSR